MRAINHALTGALIGLTIDQPVIALPVALASHFVLDAIPHWDVVGNKDGRDTKLKQKWLRSRLFRQLLVADAALCLLLVVALAIVRPQHWLTACLCAFLGAAPDFVSVKRYIATLRRKAWKPGLYTKFAGAIQWYEEPLGGVVEIAWLSACLMLLAPFLR